MTFGKIFRRTIIMFFIFSIIPFSAVTHAEIKTYTGEGSYVMSKFENLEIARERAKIDAMRNACEKAGTYVKSYSRARDFELEEDIIETMTSNILKLVEKPIFQMLEEVDNLEGIMIRVTIKAQIDDSDITRWLNKNDNEKFTLVVQNEALRKANEEQERQIAELKRQLANNPKDREQITQALADEDKIFLSNQRIADALKLYDKGDYNEAIKIHNEEIKYNPNNAFAYYGRGAAYNELEQYELAIQDFNKAIELNPKYYKAYNNRGLAYQGLKQYTKAIEDYTRAIARNPNNAEAYNNRGFAYTCVIIPDYYRAIKEYTKAIELNPNLVEAYVNRGIAYIELYKFEQAIQDCNKAIERNPNLVAAYNSRGIAYMRLKQYSLAIQDFDKALDINPNYAPSKTNLEICYRYFN